MVAVAVAASLVAALPGVVAERATALAEPGACGDVYFLGARGAGQVAEEQSGFGVEVSEILDNLRNRQPSLTIRAEALRYRAVSLDLLKPTPRQIALAAKKATLPFAVESYRRNNLTPFLKAIGKGEARALDALRARAQKCADERIVLAGYSLGAMALHRALGKLDDAGETRLLTRIDGVVLVADGDRVPDSSGTRLLGNPAAGRDGRGIRSYLGNAQDVPELVRPRTTNVCTENDLVCDFRLPSSLTDFSAARAVHGSYDGGVELTKATARVAKRLQRTVP